MSARVPPRLAGGPAGAPWIPEAVALHPALVLLSHCLHSPRARVWAARHVEWQRLDDPTARVLFERIVVAAPANTAAVFALGAAVAVESLDLFDTFVRAWHVLATTRRRYPVHVVAAVLGVSDLAPEAEAAA